MFCSNCGNEIADGSKFCSFCGTPMAVNIPEQVSTKKEDVIFQAPISEEPVSRAASDVIAWNTSDYPSKGEVIEKTEPIAFDWGANPSDISDRYTRSFTSQEAAEVRKAEEMTVESIIPAAKMPSPAGQMGQSVASPQEASISAADRLNRFYTFGQENENFRQLLDSEYDKIQAGNPIGQEREIASRVAEQRFEERPVDSSMEAFLESEGVVKPYQPKEFESDVLQRIEAQERAKEEARLAAEAERRAIEEARLAAEREARLAAEAKLREEEAEAKLREEAQRIAMERARQEAEEKQREEARLAAAEAKLKEEAARREQEIRRAEEERRLAAEEEARLARAEEARKKAAEEEAAKIKLQREARLIAEAEAKAKAEAERARAEEARAREKLLAEEKSQRLDEEAAAAAAAAKRVMAYTARMKEEEAAKIREAIAGLKKESEEGEMPSVSPAFETPQVAASYEAPIAEPAYEAPVIKPAYEAPETPEPAPVFETPNFSTAQDTVIEPALQRQETGFMFEPEKNIFFRDEEPQLIDSEDLRSAVEASAKKAEEETARRIAQLREEEQIEKAKATEAFIAGFNEPAEPTPLKSVEELLGDDLFSNLSAPADDEVSATRVIDKEAILASTEHTTRLSKEALAAAAQATEEEQPPKQPVDDVEDFFKQLTDIPESKKEEVAKEEVALEEEPPVEAIVDEKPGLSDTIIMTSETKTEQDNSFDSYGEAEAEAFKQQQMASEEAKVDDEEPSEESPEPQEEKGGAGRVVLKILLVLLIVIFAVELAGIGIKFLAPNSKATEIIDNQLNKVIHLITGYETNYDIPGIEYEA